MLLDEKVTQPMHGCNFLALLYDDANHDTNYYSMQHDWLQH